MRKQLMLLLTLSALLAYRPGHAQARPDLGGDSPTLVASTRAKPSAVRPATEATASRTTSAAKKEATAAKKKQPSINRFWSRIMGICSEVHTAAKKKS